MELHKIKSDHLREIERRRVNKVRIKNNLIKFTPGALNIPQEVFGMSGPALAEAAPSKGGLTAAQFDAAVKGSVKVESSPVESSSSPNVVTTKPTSSAKADKAVFDAAFAAAPEKRQRQAGRWACGLVNHHGIDPKQAVTVAVKVAKSPTGGWKDCLAAAGV